MLETPTATAGDGEEAEMMSDGHLARPPHNKNNYIHASYEATRNQDYDCDTYASEA